MRHRRRLDLRRCSLAQLVFGRKWQFGAGATPAKKGNGKGHGEKKNGCFWKKQRGDFMDLIHIIYFKALYDPILINDDKSHLTTRLITIDNY